ncbi:MAG TPA: hypothetical protein VFI31_06375 [Pirellulales bacterium]|nr:hypothetical protein [Pirellulales bacterium]
MDPSNANVAKPVRSHARKLIIASLALAVCRVVSNWDSILAGLSALLVLAVLAASIVAGMPRVRRILLAPALPLVILLNALVFALGAFVVFLGAQDMLPDGRIGNALPWSWGFTVVPLAAAANFVALAKPGPGWRWRRPVWLANLASACYAAFFWRSGEAYTLVMGFAVPVAATFLVGVVIASLTTIVWDARARSATAGGDRRPLRARKVVPAAGLIIVGLVWLALVPVYRKRQIAHALNAAGFHASFGRFFPSWRLPFNLPFEFYAYFGEVNSVSAFEGIKGDMDEVGRLLGALPWLEYLQVNQIPPTGQRLLQSLAGNMRLRHIGLQGAGVTDETLAIVGQIPALNGVALINGQFTDDGLAHLAGAKWLQYLAIRETPISGEGLRHLTSLPRLTRLDLGGTQIGDRQLAVIGQFTVIEMLSLNDSTISDDGLSALAPCKTLRMIDLTGTLVTAEGVERLRRTLPACTVVWSDPADEQ